MANKFGNMFETCAVENVAGHPVAAQVDGLWWLFMPGEVKTFQHELGRWLQREFKVLRVVRDSRAAGYAGRAVSQPIDPGAVPYWDDLLIQEIDVDEVKRRGKLEWRHEEHYTVRQVRDMTERAARRERAIKQATADFGDCGEPKPHQVARIAQAETTAGTSRPPLSGEAAALDAMVRAEG